VEFVIITLDKSVNQNSIKIDTSETLACKSDEILALFSNKQHKSLKSQRIQCEITPKCDKPLWAPLDIDFDRHAEDTVKLGKLEKNSKACGSDYNLSSICSSNSLTDQNNAVLIENEIQLTEKSPLVEINNVNVNGSIIKQANITSKRPYNSIKKKENIQKKSKK